jgi:hypothetical protein
MPIIFNSSPRLIHLPGQKKTTIVLKPGPNPIPDSVFDLAMKGGKAGDEEFSPVADTQATRALFEAGADGTPAILVNKGGKVADPDAQTGEMVGDELLGLPAKDATMMAGATTDEATIKRWLQVENKQQKPRHQVVEALSGALEKVKLDTSTTAAEAAKEATTAKTSSKK